MSDSEGTGTARPAKVTYDVGALFQDIRDELRDLNVAMTKKADAAEVRALADRMLVMETDFRSRAQFGEGLIREFRDSQRELAMLKEDSVTRDALDEARGSARLNRRALLFAVITSALAAAGVVINAIRIG